MPPQGWRLHAEGVLPREEDAEANKSDLFFSDLTNQGRVSKGERDQKCGVYRTVSPGRKCRWMRDGSVPLWKAQPEIQTQVFEAGVG